jgi:hypothetical protein
VKADKVSDASDRSTVLGGVSHFFAGVKRPNCAHGLLIDAAIFRGHYA